MNVWYGAEAEPRVSEERSQGEAQWNIEEWHGLYALDLRTAGILLEWVLGGAVR